MWPWVAVIIAIIVSIIILGIGIWLSLELDDWTIFSRSGSLLVVIALALAILDHSNWLQKVINVSSDAALPEFKEKLKQNFLNKVTERLSKHNLQKSEDEIEYIVNIEISKYIEEVPNRIGSTVKRSFQKYELIIAAIGTIVWGFGDLAKYI